MQTLFKYLGDILKNTLVFLSEYLGRENSIRSLYLVILTIPSVCLLLLYHQERVHSEELEVENKKLQIEVNKNYKLYITAKDSVRATLFKEYIELAKAMNDLQESLNTSNDEKSKKILKYSNKVENELNKIE